MFKLASLIVSAAFIFQAHSQIPSTGIPASVSSPTANGQQHGIPASVVSPHPGIQGVNRPAGRVIGSRRPVRPFGDHHRRAVVVPVPLFYPAYGQTYDAQAAVTDPADPGAVESSDAADPAGNDSSVSADEEALRRAYLQGARDALSKQADRYGRHYTDSRETTPARTMAQNRPAAAPAPAPPEVDNSPGTVFIFKDGHQIETKNFAIMGRTLYDFSSSNLRKVELSDLDTAATQKANDDRGISVKLP